MKTEFERSQIPNITSTDDHDQIEEIGPIEAEMRAKISRLKDTKYPDTFDWSIYDKIASKLDETPRGGVVFNTTLKLVNHHSTCSKCHYSFEIDSYGRGCFHDCVYCYAKDQLTSHGYWNRPQPFPVNLAEVRKIFYTVFETSKKSKWRDILGQRVPLRIGSMSDSFMWMDTKYGVTKELLKILNFYKYPYVIFTRSDLVAHDDYISLVDKDLASVQFSISGNNSKLIRRMEPGAPTFNKRLKALAKLADHGIWTTVRLNPLFPIFPDGYFTNKEKVISRFGTEANIPKFPTFDEDMFKSLADAKVPSVLAGFVRLSRYSISNITKATGVDFKEFFDPEIQNGPGDRHYSDPEIKYYYEMISAMCRKFGIRFTTCYIGNGLKDYYQYQDLWDNKNDCCDVVGNVKAFTKTSQVVGWSERTKHSPCKEAAIKNQQAEIEMDKKYSKKPTSTKTRNKLEKPDDANL